jgi:mRNA interferase MazF
LVDLGMAAKVRPCLVISVPTADEDRALVTLVPHTTTIRQTRFESEVSVHFLKQGVFDAQGLVTVPSAKLMRRLGTLRADQLSAVEKRLRAWLGFSED